MTQTDFPRRRRLPLAVRLSFILMLAAVLPLLVAVGFSEYNARPALIAQANDAMQTDAQTHTRLIDAYLTERLLDAETLSQVPSVQSFLLIPPSNPPGQAFLQAAPHALYALAAGEYRDKHYLAWWLFYPDGTPSLSYPQHIQPHQYGRYLVPPEQLKALKSDKTGQSFFSPVYYDTALHKAFIDIYAPIYQDGNPKEPLLGFMRASLNLDYIWSILQGDKGFNSRGSAFLLDQNGVRIADTNPKSSSLFTAVAPLAPQVSQQIVDESWYGVQKPVTVRADSNLNEMRQHTMTRAFTPGGEQEEYQAASSALTVQPWTYFVLNPSRIVTQVADDQLRNTLIVAIVVVLLAGIIGFWVSGRITRPIMRSADQIRESSEALNGLAQKQQGASSEQSWVVESIQVGLQSLQYYTDATRIAAHRLGEIGLELRRNWQRQDNETIQKGLQQVIAAATYIEKATNYQGDSSQKLATAVKVTAQVNEQLAEGAISATEAAAQLEMVVNDLRGVIGH